jgi:hypothetical protein
MLVELPACYLSAYCPVCTPVTRRDAIARAMASVVFRRMPGSTCDDFRAAAFAPPAV